MSNENPESALLSVAIEDGTALRAAHMPFIVHGGLFIPTRQRHRLGDEVFVLLRLMRDPHRLPVAGRVVWITPSGAPGGKPQGVGVQFSDHDDVVRRRLAACLRDYPDVIDDTYTL